MPILEKTKSLLSKAGTTLKPTISDEEAKALHSDLVKIVTQLKTTQSIMTDNSSVINELSLDNKDLADLLKSGLSEDTSDIMEKILNKQTIDAKEVTKLLTSFETITDTVSNIGASLDVNLGDLIDNFKPLLADSRLDIESRRKILGEIRDYTKEQNLSEGILKDLEAINIDELNFTKDESANLEKVLGELIKSSGDVVSKTTLTKLNKSLDSAVLTKSELSDILEKQTEGGGTFVEKFKKFPEVFSTGAGSQMKTAGLTSGLDAIIPGLGSILESTGVSQKLSDVTSLKGAKSVLGAGAGGLKRMLPTGQTKESEDVGGKLDEINNSLEEMTDMQEDEKKQQKKQTDVMKDGFDDLEDEQKKTRRRIRRSGGKGGGILSTLAGGLGIGALMKGGKGGMAKTLAKGLGGLVTKNPAILAGVATATASYYAGKGIYKFLLKDKVDKFFESREQKALDKLNREVPEEGRDVSARETKLREAEADAANEERINEAFKESVGKLEFKDTLKTPELKTLEKTEEGFTGKPKELYAPTPPSFPSSATMRSSDRKVSIEDPYIAIVQSLLLD